MTGPFTAEQWYELHRPPAEVFAALTDPKKLVLWFLSGAKIEARKDGPFGFDWEGGYHMDGAVLDIDPGKSVAFRWVDAQPDGTQVVTRVDFTVAPSGSGTLLSMRHTGFTSPTHYAECASRWAYYLTNLKSVLDHGTDLRSPNDW